MADADVVLFVLQYPHVIQTVLQKVVLQQEKGTLPVLKRRQRTAFPPNYIHSLDSTHMMMTALACKQEGTCCRQSTEDIAYSEDAPLNELKRMAGSKRSGGWSIV